MEEEKSYILIQFADVASAHIIARKFENVTSEQIIAAAAILEVLGKNQFIYEENERIRQQQEMSLTIPKTKIEIANK